MSVFRTTRWSLILAARDRGADAERAFAELCAAYRAPVLAFVRRGGHAAAEAEDLTQAFFLKLLEKRYDAAADPTRGRFRTFLLTVLKAFLANAHDAAGAAKRGGGAVAALDDAQAATLTDAAHLSPEREFERAFALAVFERALAKLSEEAASAGKGPLFAALVEFLREAPQPGQYQALQAALGMRANTIAATVRRLRERLVELVRREIAEIVAEPSDVDRELRALRALLSGP